MSVSSFYSSGGFWQEQTRILSVAYMCWQIWNQDCKKHEYSGKPSSFWWDHLWFLPTWGSFDFGSPSFDSGIIQKKMVPKRERRGGLPFGENSQIIQYKRQWFPIICHLASVIVFIVKLKLMLKKQTSPGCPEHWSGPHTGRTGNAPRKQTKSNFLVFSEGKKKILTLYWTFCFLVSEQTK